MKKTTTIAKIYEGYESRNNMKYETHPTIKDARHALSFWKRTLVQAGASVVKSTRDCLTVSDEATGGNIHYQLTY